MAPYNIGYCQCNSSSSYFSVLFKRVFLTLSILGPVGIALHFWYRKKRLTKELAHIQEKTAQFYSIMRNDAKRFSLTPKCSHSNHISKPTSKSDNVKRLESAVDSLSQGMRVTNKRLLQLSEQVNFLRKILEQHSSLKKSLPDKDSMLNKL